MKSINLLDPAQQKTLEALINDENTNALSIVYGPPGTGKSHLITSLLFELALKGKKVLFVSQNTEALDVIVRMYEKHDKSMHKTKNDLCFLDFCLQLNNPACRKVKYLKGHKSTIMSQKIAPQYVDSALIDSGENDLTPYKLSYRYLNEDINNTSDVLGIDELLVYQMKYVNDDTTAKSVIYAIEDVDIRMIFRHLDEYKYEEAFRSLSHPDDQLKYINKENRSVGFNTLKSVSSELLNNLFNLPKGYYITKKNLDVIEYLNDLLSIRRWQDFVDLKKIEANPQKASDLFNAASKTLKLYNQISDCEKITISNDDFTCTKESIAIIKKCSDLKEVTEISSLASSYSKQLKKAAKNFGINVDIFTTGQLLTYLLKKIDLRDNCNNLTQLAEGLNNCSAQSISDIIKELEKWNEDVGLFGRKKTPAGILGELTNTSKETAAFLFGNINYLKHLEALLSGTSFVIGDLLSICKKKIPNNIYSLVESEAKMSFDDYESLINLLLKIEESHWCDDCENIKIATSFLEDLSSYGAFVKDNIELNKKKHFDSIEEALLLIAKNINNNKYLKQIAEMESEYRTYNADPKEDFKSFCNRISESDINRLSDILDKIENISGTIDVSCDRILGLINYISSLRDEKVENVFNGDFYRIIMGGNLNNWLDRCNNIFAFNDINEFDSFIEHNDFIRRLKAMFGDRRNSQLVDQYLDMDIDYRSFCNYLCRDIIDAKIGSMSTADRKNVNDANFFKLYKNVNYIERSRHYDRGLYSLKLKYEDPSRALTDAINKTAGMHNIERYRKCSDKIVNAFPVIIATPSEVSKYIDAKRYFDYVVFDEASQLLPGQALPSLYRAERAIVVGDPHQMPPSLTTVIGFNDNNEDDDETEEFGQSILDMIKGLQTADEYHLTTHYRSESNQLFEPSRKAIYEEEGIQPIFEAKSDRMPIYISDNLGEDNNANFGKIIQRIRYYLAQDPNTSFCILFSRGDKMGLYAFRKYFDNNGANLQDIVKLYDENRLLISTIRDCQGIEGDHTILYLPQYRSVSSMWFFNEKAGAYKRLNVAVTRQRKTLDIIMGDSRGKWLSECQRILNDPVGPNQEKSAKLFLTLLSKAGQEINDEYLDKELSPNANYIDSPLTRQIYQKLCEHYKDRIGEDLRIWCEVGYKLVIPSNDAMSQNHESVGYRIDIGIYSIKHRKFVLGIEMDGSTYHSGFIKEFSDLQRQDILEMKGWNIYRIWSTNWIKDTNREFVKLTEEIDHLLDEPVEDEYIQSEETLIDTSDFSSNQEDEDKFPLATGDMDATEDENDEQGGAKIIHKDILGDKEFVNDFLKSCRGAKKCGTFLRIKRDDVPEFEDVIVHDIAPDLSYILVKYEKTSSFFKVKVDKVESFVLENSV